MKRKFIILARHSFGIASVIVLTMALTTGCSTKPVASATEQKEEQNQFKMVKVTTIKTDKIGDPLEQIADVSAAVQLDVVAKAGGDIIEIVKKRGATVRAGEIILRLDPTDSLINKEKAALALSQAKENYKNAKNNFADSQSEMQNHITKAEQALNDVEKAYNKMKNDYDLGLVDKFRLDQEKTKWNGVKLDLENLQKKQKTLEASNPVLQAQQTIENANLAIRENDRMIEKLNVKAPASGVLTELPVEVGMSLTPGFKIGQVQQIDPIKIKAELTESVATLISGKKELFFYIPGVVDKMVGQVSYFSDVMNAQTKSFSLELSVPNPDGKLKPGAKAQMMLTTDEEQMVTVIPTTSIVREGAERFVFILDGDHVEKRKVELGRLNNTMQEVKSGVKPDEQLVIFGQNQLKDQEKVQIAR